jgi:hypothetical protein
MERSNSFCINPIVLLKASVTSPWALITDTASSLRLHERETKKICFVTYVALPSDDFVCFNTNERSNSSRFDDALESTARFEASRAARISLFSLELV